MAAIGIRRLSHPTLIAADVEETIRFYTEVLGMQLVLREPSLEDPDSERIFLDAGDDCFIAFFGPRPGLPPNRVPSRPGVGYMLHLALEVDDRGFQKAQEELRKRGIPFSGPVDRGFERSMYLRDPNGIVLKLLSWAVPPPARVSKKALIRRAQALRLARGHSIIERQDLEQAARELAGQG